MLGFRKSDLHFIWHFREGLYVWIFCLVCSDLRVDDHWVKSRTRLLPRAISTFYLLYDANNYGLELKLEAGQTWRGLLRRRFDLKVLAISPGWYHHPFTACWAFRQARSMPGSSIYQRLVVSQIFEIDGHKRHGSGHSWLLPSAAGGFSFNVWSLLKSNGLLRRRWTSRSYKNGKGKLWN